MLYDASGRALRRSIGFLPDYRMEPVRPHDLGELASAIGFSIPIEDEEEEELDDCQL